MEQQASQQQSTPKPSKANLQDHYKVTVEGTYLCKNGRDETIKPYKFTFPVPLSVKTNMPERHFNPEKQEHYWKDNVRECTIDEIGILSYLLRSRKILDACIKHDPNTSILKTHEIVNLVPSGEHVRYPSDPRALSYEQLKKYIRANGLRIDVALFPTAKKLREALSNFKESPDAYPTWEGFQRRKAASISAMTEAGNKLEEHYGSPINEASI